MSALLTLAGDEAQKHGAGAGTLLLSGWEARVGYEGDETIGCRPRHISSAWAETAASPHKGGVTRGRTTAGTVAVVALRSNAAGADEYDDGPADAEPAYGEAA
jgi:hypothetical protein